MPTTPQSELALKSTGSKDLFGSEIYIKEPKPSKAAAIDQSVSYSADYSSERIVLSAISINPCSTTIYNYIASGPSYSRSENLPDINRRKEDLSVKAARRLKKKIQWMQFASDTKVVYSRAQKKRLYYKLNFITLTLPCPQMHSDEWIKSKMLESFLYWMKRSHKASTYVWKAECQDNGNIHFHITSNLFIHWRAIQAKWRSVCHAHGYKSSADREGKKIHDASTQVKAVHNDEKIAAYIASYVSKKDKYKSSFKKFISCAKNQKVTVSKEEFSVRAFPNPHLKRIIKGRLWGCSQNLSGISCTVKEEDINIWEVIKWQNKFNDITNLKDKIIANGYAAIEKNITMSDTSRYYAKMEVENYAEKFRNTSIHQPIGSLNNHTAIVQALAQVKKQINAHLYQPSYIEVESFS